MFVFYLIMSNPSGFALSLLHTHIPVALSVYTTFTTQHKYQRGNEVGGGGRRIARDALSTLLRSLPLFIIDDDYEGRGLVHDTTFTTQHNHQHGNEVGGGGRRVAMDVNVRVEECVLRERESSGVLTLLIIYINSPYIAFPFYSLSDNNKSGERDVYTYIVL